MTGFGVGRASLAPGGSGGETVVAEVRSLNHRFVEVRVKLASELGDHAFFVEQHCRRRLTRGRVDIQLRFESTLAGGAELDLERAEHHYRALTALRDRLAPEQDVPLSLLASWPDIFGSAQRRGVETIRPTLVAALDAAFEQLDAMRQREGSGLEAELVALLASARGARMRIAQESSRLADYHRSRLRERVRACVADAHLALSEGRLETEIALLCERADVAEELARLDSHFAQFEDLLQQAEPVGRRLDFLLQEIGREANTIGAKCQAVDLTSAVVDLKAAVEKLREQVQNVE